MRRCSNEQGGGRRQQCGGWRGEGDERRREQLGTLYSNPLVPQIKSIKHAQTRQPSPRKICSGNRIGRISDPGFRRRGVFVQNCRFGRRPVLLGDLSRDRVLVPRSSALEPCGHFAHPARALSPELHGCTDSCMPPPSAPPFPRILQ